MLLVMCIPAICSPSYLLYLLVVSACSCLLTAGSVEDINEYSRHYSASVNSHMSFSSDMNGMNPFADIPGSNEPYPAWTQARQIPMSTEEIEDIFLDLAQKFGFQRDSMRNMVSHVFDVSSFQLITFT